MVVAITGAGCSGRSEHSVAAPLTPTAGNVEALLEQVEAKYAAAGSYSDTGVVVTTFEGSRTFTNRKPFATTFDRGRAFRFEFSDSFFGSCTRYVVWSTGDDVLSWWTVHGHTTRHDSLARALAGPTGVSGRSAHTIPTLLLGGAGSGSRITDLADARIVGQQSLDDGAASWVVSGRTPRRNVPLTVWIEKDSLAIRRIHEESRLRDGTGVTATTIYRPRFGVAVDPQAIPFDPPPPGESGCENPGIMDRIRKVQRFVPWMRSEPCVFPADTALSGG